MISQASTIAEARAIAESNQLVARFDIFCFEQAPFVVNQLKNDGSAIVDFSGMDGYEQAQRCLDFIAGACAALDDPKKGRICRCENIDFNVFSFGDPDDIQAFIARSASNVVKVDFGGRDR